MQHDAKQVDWDELCTRCAPLLRLAIEEDIGPGDVTSAAIFGSQPARRVSGRVVTRGETVVCGMPWAAHVLRSFDAAAQVDLLAAEGARVGADAPLLAFGAEVQAVLAAERTLLNFAMRLCGIARAAARAVECLPPGSKAEIFDTRKTLPGHRLLDKAAVRTGGARNHRMGLHDAVLIKDNHVAAAGGVAAAIEAARARVGRGMVVEVEVDGLHQLDAALAGRPDIILLDNFDDATIVEAVRRCRPHPVLLEASGNVTEARLPALAQTGVDRISMGSLTHSVTPADLSLEVTP